MIKYFYILSFLWIALATQAQDLHVSFMKTEIECQLATASVSVITGAQPVHYMWSTGAITSSIDQLEEGNYSVIVTDDNSHDTTLHFRIIIPVCEPSPATGFTPNFDGYFDTWSIGRIENFPEFDLFVYNRWGQQVHHQTSTYIPWDGRSLGIPLPDATYYYVLYFSQTDKNKFIKGAVSILR